MIASLNENGLIAILVGFVLAGLAIVWISYLIHASSENQFVHVRLLPRLPRTRAKKLARIRLEAEIAEAKRDLAAAEHEALQKQWGSR